MKNQTQRADVIAEVPFQNDKERLRNRVVRQLGMLTVQFLLGMAVNLIGMPQETASGFGRTAIIVIVMLHILIGIGLLVGALLTYRPAAGHGPVSANLALSGGISVAGAFLAGVLTMITNAGAWSFVMATGFIAAFLLYGMLYRQAWVEK